MSAHAATQATVVRPAVRADAKAICDLHIATVRALCAPFYEPQVIEGWLRGRVPDGYFRGIDAGTMFVADAGNQLIGWGQAHPGEVDAVFVDPRFVRRGIGALLLRHALESATANRDTVKVESTLNAVAFYERFGFQVVRRSTQRRNDVDVTVVVMEKHAG
jgi:putative acetyltransferase